MKRYVILFACAFAVAGTFLFSEVKADTEEAWKQLSQLNISDAKAMFANELASHPDDLACMRGLLLASHFDLDYATQIEMIERLIAADKSSPNLAPLSEFVNAELGDWAECNRLSFEIGEALANNAKGPWAHTGRLLMEGYYTEADFSLPEGWLRRMNYAPGCWVCGPFENNSNIAAYRPVEFENQSLDTLATVAGKIGTRAGWTWLPADDFGNFLPYYAIENTQDVAMQARFYFELPDDMEILVLMGGALNYRILFDGVPVHDDPRYRNAVQREAFEIDAGAGMHEITVVLGTTDQGLTFGLQVLNSDYENIDGFKWHRYGKVKRGGSFDVEQIHPLFDPFESYVAEHGEEPDTRLWRTYLQIYNGYSDEAVRTLETLYHKQKADPIDIYLLFVALTLNNEPQLGLRYLSTIMDDIHVPLIEFRWIENTVENYEIQVNTYCQLDSVYPDRFPIELTAGLKPLLKQDKKGLFENYDRLLQKYPNAVGIHSFLTMMYSQVVRDPEAAYREAKAFSEQANNKRYLITTEPRYLVTLARYDEAIEKARQAFYLSKYSDQALTELYYTYSMAKREKEMIPILDSLKEIYPYNIELYSKLYEIYSEASEYDKANKVLERIHAIKPSAVKPYQVLESLHNNETYDKIFGSVDVLEYWDMTPTPEQLNNNDFWYVLDKRQALLFDSGVVLKDIHYAIALLDEDVIAQYQEMNLGFDPDYSFNNLLVAQRLRKGQPPMAGTVEGEYAVFQDLKPGDVIEIHYRYWESRDGDLWNEFWGTYMTHSDFFQRYWDYTILTNRDDIRYLSIDPAPDPKISKHCGFKKYTWSGEKTPALNMNNAMLPPVPDIVGVVIVTTLDNWDVLNDWYYSISQAVLGDNPRADALADSLVGGIMSDSRKLEVLFEHIVMGIPYQMIGFDYHASIPRKPDDVLLNRWGDCKDKGHLLIHMLRHVGLEAWPVLVMTRDLGTSMPLPYFGFNHLIAGCIIDGDTLYVDATDIPVDPKSSIANDIAGQPILQVGLKGFAKKLKKLPDAESEDSHWKMKMVLQPSEGSKYRFRYIRDYYKLEAGLSRYDLRGYSSEELRNDLESAYSDNWGVILSIDSVTFDTPESIAPEFNQTWYGEMEISTQKIGNTTIMNLPSWSTISKGLIPMLGDPDERRFPVDRNDYIGVFEKELEIKVPDDYGRPKPIKAFELKKGQLQFEYDYNWNDDTRTLNLVYNLKIEQGYSKPKDFTGFIKKVIDTFDSPLLFEK